MTETEHKPDHRENIDRQHQTRYIVYDKSQTNYCQHNEANKPYQYHLKSPFIFTLTDFPFIFMTCLKKDANPLRFTPKGVLPIQLISLLTRFLPLLKLRHRQ